MRRHSLVSCIALMLCLMGLATLTIAADDPFVGTWKFNADKSKFQPGVRHFQSFTLKVEAKDYGLSTIGDGLDADGKPVHLEVQHHIDGKDYPVKTNYGGDSQTERRIDAKTFHVQYRKAGNNIANELWSISNDGKTLSITNKVNKDGGEEVVMVRVLDKQ